MNEEPGGYSSASSVSPGAPSGEARLKMENLLPETPAPINLLMVADGNFRNTVHLDARHVNRAGSVFPALNVRGRLLCGLGGLCKRVSRCGGSSLEISIT